MRYTDEHKAEVRARIVAEASAALRRAGLDGVSIPALMKRAGLTHGGFYAHFEDRDELVAEAVEHAAGQTSESVFEPAKGIGAVLDAYLSREHVRHPERGCVVAALGADGPRQKAVVRKAFSYAAKGLMGLVQKKLGGKSDALTDEAIELTARMVGAIVLARLIDDEALSDRVLAVARAGR
ncbi:MAG: TetR/AcrR family transcriptional regulator [Myxococcales bacterium]|nr:TetR/AcrR family transcriptional regulator [Myxococcales bacterium]